MLTAMSSSHGSARPRSAHQMRGRKLIACTAVVATTQPRFVPSRRTASGVTNCSTAPTNSGAEAVSPVATGPNPRARAKAGM